MNQRLTIGGLALNERSSWQNELQAVILLSLLPKRRLIISGQVSIYGKPFLNKFLLGFWRAPVHRTP